MRRLATRIIRLNAVLDTARKDPESLKSGPGNANLHNLFGTDITSDEVIELAQKNPDLLKAEVKQARAARVSAQKLHLETGT